MTGHALGPGTTARRRALFGLLDANGWSWASLKAFAWFVIIIFMLGYLPDRAYYFTVFPTIDLGILAWSPVNLCPPENRTLPCPAPAGALVAWEPSPPELALPARRVDGALVQTGKKLLYIGGTDGETAVDTVFLTDTYGEGNFGPWREGAPLPAARADAGVVFLNGAVYVIGGSDASGTPTDTVFVATIDPASGDLGEWQAAGDADPALALPAPRTGLSAVAAADGIIVVGGSDASGPTDTVWKSTLDQRGALGEWAPQAPLVRPQSDGLAAIVGGYLWLFSGSDANGASGAVQRGEIATANEQPNIVTRWALRDGPPNLPVARTDAAGFASNGTLYLIGGSDGTSPRGEVYWAAPDGAGEIAEWKHLAQSDLPPAGLEGGAAIASGSHAFVVGGQTADGPIASGARANLAPKPPFFQLGLVGATVPALKIEGEVGQQIGYLNAAGVGTVNFILLLLIGWAFAHPERARQLWQRFRGRRG